MNKVVVEGTITYADGCWLTILAGKEDVHGYVKGNAQVFEHNYVRAEGYLVATNLDSNRFIITKLEHIKARKSDDIDLINE